MKRAKSMTNVHAVKRGMTSPLRASGVSFVVYGNCASLKNSRRLVKNKRNDTWKLIRSSASIAFMEAFQYQVPPECRNLKLGSLKEPLRLVATVYYYSRRSDLDVSAVMDGLQATGVIANDRFIIEQHLYAEVDAKNPRVELTVELI